MNHYKSLPQLSEEEIRVLGSLIEKSKTTLEYYPLSLNSLTAACNQKSSRKPVVEYDEATVQHALNSLKGQSLVSVAIGGGSRTIKYKHNFTTVYPLSEGELAILCLLFLRGPLTPGEINSISGRLHEFSSLESVIEQLHNMSQNENPFIKEMPKLAGQKESRYVHLLGDKMPVFTENLLNGNEKKQDSEIELRIHQLEKQVVEMKAILDDLIRELKG